MRRGGSAGKRKAAPRVKVPKKIAGKLPVSQASANRWAAVAFGLFLALIAAVVLGRATSFLRDWIPFVLLIFGYEYLRGIAGDIVVGDHVGKRLHFRNCTKPD